MLLTALLIALLVAFIFEIVLVTLSYIKQGSLKQSKETHPKSTAPTKKQPLRKVLYSSDGGIGYRYYLCHQFLPCHLSCPPKSPAIVLRI
jgi:lipopolysaccharide export LptBFGC system permease protein LptF